MSGLEEVQTNKKTFSLTQEFLENMRKHPLSQAQIEFSKKLDDAFNSIKLDNPIPKIQFEEKELLWKPGRYVSKYVHWNLNDYTDEEVFNIIIKDMNLNKDEVLAKLEKNK